MRKALLRALIVGSRARAAGRGRRGAGDQAADRQHRHRRRRRLHPEHAAEARKRADQAVTAPPTSRPRDGTRPSPLRDARRSNSTSTERSTPAGLEKCTMKKLMATTTVDGAEALPGAIVGAGFGTALVELPEQRADRGLFAIDPVQRPVSSTATRPCSATPTLNYPAPTTYVIPIEIQNVHHGRYGFKTVAHFPRIVNDYGSPISGHLTIGREWTYRGQKLSYANAHCADGRLQAKAQFSFEDGSFVEGTVFKPCKVAQIGRPGGPTGRPVVSLGWEDDLGPTVAPSPCLLVLAVLPSPRPVRRPSGSGHSCCGRTAASSPRRCRSGPSRRSASRGTPTSRPPTARCPPPCSM